MAGTLLPESMVNNKYYVYVYFDTRKPKGKYVYQDVEFDYEPFYVGKGCSNRKNRHLNKQVKENLFKTNIIKKIIKETNQIPLILEFKSNLSNCAALELEKELINKIGRRNINKGPLTNLSDGDKGNTGFRFNKDQLLEFKNRWKDPSYKLKMKEAYIKFKNSDRYDSFIKDKQLKMKEMWKNNPSLKINSSQKMKNLYENSEIFREQMKVMRNNFQNSNKAKTVYKKTSERMKQRWKDDYDNMYKKCHEQNANNTKNTFLFDKHFNLIKEFKTSLECAMFLNKKTTSAVRRAIREKCIYLKKYYISYNKNYIN